MSDQQKEQAPKKRPAKGRDVVAPESTPADAAVVAAVPEPVVPPPEPEPACVSDPAPTIAAAALAEAIEGARKPSEAPAPERASEPAAVKVEARPIEVPLRAVTPAPTRPRYALQAAAVILALGAGWVGGSHLGASATASATAPAWAEAASAGIRDNRDDLVRLAGDVRALKVTLEALKDGLDKPRPDAGTRQVMERLERSERVALDASARLVKVAEQLDRIEREPAKAAGSLTERLERIERQVIATANTVASAPVPVAAAAKAATPIPDPTQTASLPKPDPRQTRIEGWVLLEVYDGAALVESRNKVHEVALGQTLPGVGKVLAIEKRGKAWMVVTDKGFIGAEVR
jgi:hypothetical protein